MTGWSVILNDPSVILNNRHVIPNEVKNLPEFLISRLRKKVGERRFDYNSI